MAYVGESGNVMRPEMGDITMEIPISLEYSGGRADNRRSTIIWTVALSVVGVVLFFIIIIGTRMNLLLKFLLAFGIDYILLFIIRYVLWKEKTIRRNYKLLDASDYKLDWQDIWGIYDIEEVYPYCVRYRNGMSGIFVRLNKDVILGKYEESEYNHYEAIGDAYNIAGSSNLSMCHVDYMDNVGSDARLQESFSELSKVKNPDVKDALTDLFSHLQQQMNNRVTTFDIYVFTYRCSDKTAWAAIQRILACFLDANYVNYRVLDKEDIRELAKALFNLKEFSVNEASIETFNKSTSSTIKPIKIIHADGSEEVLNKTTEEKRYEEESKKNRKRNRKERAREEKRARREADKARRRGKVKSEDEELNIF